MLAATMMATLAGLTSGITNTNGNTYKIKNYSDDDILEEFLRPRFLKGKIKTQCLLKGCEAMTSHNGGYCCARHCKLDRERRNAIKKVQHDTFTSITGSLPK